MLDIACLCKYYAF